MLELPNIQLLLLIGKKIRLEELFRTIQHISRHRLYENHHQFLQINYDFHY